METNPVWKSFNWYATLANCVLSIANIWKAVKSKNILQVAIVQRILNVLICW